MIRNKYHYAVVVGINTYPGGYQALSGPVNDAHAFAEWLTDPLQGGLPKRNVKKILTPMRPPVRLPTAKPTKELVDDAIWCARQSLGRALQEVPDEEQSELRRRSRLYIFVAGHGMMPGGDTAALLDAKAVRGKLSNLELKSYVDWLVADGQFAEVCVFSDCCRNYELLAQPGLPPFDRPGEAGGEVMSLLLLATTAGHMSFEETDDSISADERRGYFSRALVDGLRGNAADPQTGFVTYDGLRAYIDRLLYERTKNRPFGLRQRVATWQSGDDLTFGPPRMTAARTSQEGMFGPPGRERRKAIIRFDTHLRGRVELVSPDGSTQLWDPQDGPWIVWLFDGTWYVQHEGRPMDASGFANGGLIQVSGEDRDVQL